MLFGSKQKEVANFFKMKRVAFLLSNLWDSDRKCIPFCWQITRLKTPRKGIQQHFSKTKLKHELYKSCLEEELRTFAEYNSIRSFKHDVYTNRENKVALSSFDDKRYLLKDSHNTLAYGHYRIPKK